MSEPSKADLPPLLTAQRQAFEAWISIPARLTVGARLNSSLRESLWLAWQDAWEAALRASGHAVVVSQKNPDQDRDGSKSDEGCGHHGDSGDPEKS